MVESKFKKSFERLFFVDPGIVAAEELVEVAWDGDLGPGTIVVGTFWKVGDGIFWLANRRLDIFFDFDLWNLKYISSALDTHCVAMHDTWFDLRLTLPFIGLDIAVSRSSMSSSSDRIPPIVRSGSDSSKTSGFVAATFFIFFFRKGAAAVAFLATRSLFDAVVRGAVVKTWEPPES